MVAPWTPHGGLADETGYVRDEFVWAALDCPGAFADTNRRSGPIVLGRFSVKMEKRVSPQEQYVVMGWELGNNGRKFQAGTALFSAEGQLCSLAQATWIELKGTGPLSAQT